MKRMGFFFFFFVIAFALATSNHTVFANSCCGVKRDTKECSKEDAKECAKAVSASESSDNNCPVCGQAADSKGKQVDVKHAGETVHLCCEGCKDAYNENPRQSHQAKPPKKKKQRGEGYY